MSIRPSIILAAAILYLVSVAPATAEPAAPLRLRVASEEAHPVKYRADEDGRPVGLCPDILAAIHDFDPSILFVGAEHWVPQKRLLLMLGQGDLDVACGFRQVPDRMAVGRFIDTPVFNSHLVVATGHDDPFDAAGFEDFRHWLKPGDVILMNNGALLKSEMERLGFHDIDDGAFSTPQNLMKLAKGRGRIYLNEEPGMHFEIAQAGLDDRVRVLPRLFSALQPHYLMVSTSLPEPAVARLRVAVAGVAANGRLQAIQDYWNNYRAPAK